MYRDEVGKIYSLPITNWVGESSESGTNGDGHP
jgi:hypothetical protein